MPPQNVQPQSSPIVSPLSSSLLNVLEDGKARELVVSRSKTAQQAALLATSRFSRYYNLFRNFQITKNYQGLANLFVPEPYRVVVKKTARICNAIKSIRCTPETPKDIESAKIGTHLLNYLRNKLGWRILERLAVQESRVIGISWLKLVWNLDREEADRPWKGFDLTFDTTDHVLLPPDSTIQDVFQGTNKWLIHSYISDYDTLSKNPSYRPEAIQQLVGSTSTRLPAPNVLSQSRVMFTQAQRANQIKGERKHRILEYWGKIPIETVDETGKKTIVEKEKLIVVADERITLQNEDNPYSVILDNPIPFVPIVANIVGQETYPVGDIEPAESLYNELNDTRNQRMDTVTLNIDPAKEVVRAANIDEKDLIARRGWVIKSNIPNGIRFIPPDMQGVKAATEEEKVIRGDIQQVTGVLDFSPGSDVQAGINIDTARGTIVAKGDADVLGEAELDLVKMSFQMLYRIALAYAQVFLDRQFTMRIVSEGVESFSNVSSEVLQGNLDLDVEMETLQDKTTAQQMALMLFNQAKTIPGANISKFFIDLLTAFKDNINIKEYYTEPQPQPPEQPKISVSLKGELSQLQASEVYKQIPGVDPHMGDPAMTEEGRQLMQGQLPETHDQHVKMLDKLQKQQQILSAISQPQNGTTESTISNQPQ